jgi:hypothetical protein
LQYQILEIKKKNYNNDKGNFNAGMMIVPHPCLDDYIIMEDILNKGNNNIYFKYLSLLIYYYYYYYYFMLMKVITILKKNY